MKSILAFSALLLIGLAGCGSSGSSTSSGSSAASSGKIDISDFEFDPRTVTVKAGTPITWTNKDSAAHTAMDPNGGFDTGTLQKGDSKTVKVTPGTYHYVCGIHPFMKATLVVK